MTQIVIPRGELATVHNSANFTTASTTDVDVTGMSVTVTTGTRPLDIFVSLLVQNNTAGVQTEVQLLEDGVVVGGMINSAASASSWFPVTFITRRNPAAGSHVYKLQAKVDAASSLTIYGGSSYTADMSVVEV